MKPLLVTSGEPAGIGPDLCLDLVDSTTPLVVLANKGVLVDRARKLGRVIHFEAYDPAVPYVKRQGCLTVLSLSCPSPVYPGVLNPKNAPYVVEQLGMAADRCLSGEFSALVTAPVHKAVINQSGIAFTGHTEFFSSRCGVKTVVMLLACETLKVALITTHLPLGKVAESITRPLIEDVIFCLNEALKGDFGIMRPRIWVAGLNPHAGEDGHLGREEIEIISPALRHLKASGIDVQGPFSADTLFNPMNLDACDVFVAMYHDQGLPVLKYAGFGSAVNITLGLPIIRTSVDHGTALTLAGTGRASSSSLLSAIKIAAKMAELREHSHAN